jgi:rubrerythrin
MWVAAVVLFGAVASVEAARAEGPAGQELFLAQKCDMCHSVSTVGIEAKTKSAAMAGGDLVDLDHEADWLTQYLKKETQLDDKDHKKEFKGTDEELQTLVQWLLEQKT